MKFSRRQYTMKSSQAIGLGVRRFRDCLCLPGQWLVWFPLNSSWIRDSNVAKQMKAIKELRKEGSATSNMDWDHWPANSHCSPRGPSFSAYSVYKQSVRSIDCHDIVRHVRPPPLPSLRTKHLLLDTKTIQVSWGSRRYAAVTASTHHIKASLSLSLKYRTLTPHWHGWSYEKT